MNKLLLHPTTNHQYLSLINSKPQSILISGKSGSGKKFAAENLAKSILKIQDFTNYPYFMNVIPEKQHLGISEIRQIKEFLWKKTIGNSEIRRVVLIPDAHTMTIEAQNSLLKTLEEPPADTLIILTTNDLTELSLTIRSRAQNLSILSVALSECVKFFTDSGHEKSNIEKMYRLSNGRVGLLSALLNNEESHTLVESIDKAKTILQSRKYNRLVQVDELSKNKENIINLLTGMQRLVASGLEQASGTNNIAKVNKFYQLSQVIASSQDQLKSNVNPKLLLTNLFMSM